MTELAGGDGDGVPVAAGAGEVSYRMPDDRLDEIEAKYGHVSAVKELVAEIRRTRRYVDGRDCDEGRHAWRWVAPAEFVPYPLATTPEPLWPNYVGLGDGDYYCAHCDMTMTVAVTYEPPVVAK